MSKNYVFYLLIFLVTLTYSFTGYSQTLDQNKVKNCTEIKKLLTLRKDKLIENSILKKQALSDVSSSIFNYPKYHDLTSKDKEIINNFIEEYSLLVFEKEDLIVRTENLINLNCEIDKLTYSKKLDILNNNYKSQIKKEKKILEDFQESTLPKIRRIEK